MIEFLLKCHFWFVVIVGTCVFGYLSDDPEVAVGYLLYALAYITLSGIVCWSWNLYTTNLDEE